MLDYQTTAVRFLSRDANHFDIVRADTPELLDQVYRLRYQVYCLERGFVDPSAHGGEWEIDAEDDRSVHALLRHRRTGMFAGTVRVILPNCDGTGRMLPTERILANQRCRSLQCYPRTTMAEISRFLVSKEFRRRPGEAEYPDVAQYPGAVAPGERRGAPHITFGLIRAVLEICTEHRVTHLCAVMAPALIRILDQFGLIFAKIGNAVDDRGILQPCVAALDNLVESNRTNDTPLWRYTANSITSETYQEPIAA